MTPNTWHVNYGYFEISLLIYAYLFISALSISHLTQPKLYYGFVFILSPEKQGIARSFNPVP